MLEHGRHPLDSAPISNGLTAGTTREKGGPVEEGTEHIEFGGRPNGGEMTRRPAARRGRGRGGPGFGLSLVE